MASRSSWSCPRRFASPWTAVEVRTVPVEVERGADARGPRDRRPDRERTTEVEVRGAGLARQPGRPGAGAHQHPGLGDRRQRAGRRSPLVDIEGQPVGTGQVDIDPETVSVQVDVRASRDRDDRGRAARTSSRGHSGAWLRARVDHRRPGRTSRSSACPRCSSRDHVGHDRADQHRRADRRRDVRGRAPAARRSHASADGEPLVGHRRPPRSVHRCRAAPSWSAWCARVRETTPACRGLDQLTITLSGAGGALSALERGRPDTDRGRVRPRAWHLLTDTDRRAGCRTASSSSTSARAPCPVTIQAPESAPTPTPAP